MNIHIKGEYTFTMENRIILKGNNLITLLGESFFMNRWCNDYFTPLDYICLGTGSTPPEKKDTSLGNETIRKKCTKTVDLKNKIIHLKADFTSTEVKNTCEIGVSNDKVLISHDVYKMIDSSFLNNNEGDYSDITVDYKFIIETGSLHTTWTPTSITDNEGDIVENVYYRTEHDNVIGVLEKDTGNGYLQVYDFTDLHEGSYYYDKVNQNLYIFHSNLKDPNKTKDVIVKTKG